MTEGRMKMIGVKQEDVARILNAINDAIEDIGYVAVGYDNTKEFLTVLVDSTTYEDDPDTGNGPYPPPPKP